MADIAPSTRDRAIKDGSRHAAFSERIEYRGRDTHAHWPGHPRRWSEPEVLSWPGDEPMRWVDSPMILITTGSESRRHNDTESLVSGAGWIGVGVMLGAFLLLGGIAALTAGTRDGFPIALGTAIVACGATLLSAMLVAYRALNVRLDYRSSKHTH